MEYKNYKSVSKIDISGSKNHWSALFAHYNITKCSTNFYAYITKKLPWSQTIIQRLYDKPECHPLRHIRIAIPSCCNYNTLSVAEKSKKRHSMVPFECKIIVRLFDLADRPVQYSKFGVETPRLPNRIIFYQMTFFVHFVSKYQLTRMKTYFHCVDIKTQK